MKVSDESTNRILALYQAAKTNGSLISVDELARVLPQPASRVELEEAFSAKGPLGAIFQLRGDYLTERMDEEVAPISLRLEESSRAAARHNLTFARRILPLLQTRTASLIAVSGSTSYLSSSRSKDLDLFCVAQNGALWIFLTRQLIMARVISLFHQDSPGICFSCVMDESYAGRSFKTRRDTLFARDALQALVLLGEKHYRTLLTQASWISREFPSLYSERIEGDGRPRYPSSASWMTRLVNLFLYATAGTYVRVKSFISNRKFAASQKPEDQFEVKFGPDHLVYESGRYKHLQTMYQTAQESRRSTIAPQGVKGSRGG